MRLKFSLRDNELIFDFLCVLETLNFCSRDEFWRVDDFVDENTVWE